jgi:hypothetical protein
MARPLALQPPMRHPAQLGVNQRKQAVQGRGVAVAQLQEKIGDLRALARGEGSG